MVSITIVTNGNNSVFVKSRSECRPENGCLKGLISNTLSLAKSASFGGAPSTETKEKRIDFCKVLEGGDIRLFDEIDQGQKTTNLL